MNETVTQLRDTTANPAPLGLLGFGMTTILLNLHNAGFFELNSMILAMGICYGGAAQIVAGVMEWKKGNTFATTAFLSYGFFWWSLVVLVLLPKTGVATASDATAMGAYLAAWGLFTFMMFIGTFRLNRALQVVFGTLPRLFALTRSATDYGQRRLQARHGLRRNLLWPLRLLRGRRPGPQRSLRQNRAAPRSPEQITAGSVPPRPSSDCPMIEAVLHPIEVVKDEKIIRHRSHRRRDDGRRDRFAALNRSLGPDAINCAIPQCAETPGDKRSQTRSRQERNRQPAARDKASDANGRGGRGEGEDQHDRKGQRFPQNLNRSLNCPTTRRSDPPSIKIHAANSVPRRRSEGAYLLRPLLTPSSDRRSVISGIASTSLPDPLETPPECRPRRTGPTNERS